MTSLSEMENNLVGAMRDKMRSVMTVLRVMTGLMMVKKKTPHRMKPRSLRPASLMPVSLEFFPQNPTVHEALTHAQRSLKVCYEHKIPSLTRVSMFGGTADSRCCAQWRKVYADWLDFLLLSVFS